jgi:hypothetical protein
VQNGRQTVVISNHSFYLLLQDLSSIRMLQHINHTAIDGCISSDPDVHGLTRFVERCFFIFFWHVFAESSESF